MSNSPRAFAYGDHAEQRLDRFDATGETRGTVVLFHGGYWRAAFSSALMAPIAHDLSDRGWVVVNVEYRRVGAGGGWPLPGADAAAACRWVTEHVNEGLLPQPIIAIGHSVGGQLALLAAHAAPAELDGLIALAPVTDVVQTLHAGLGEDAAVALLADADDAEQSAVDASPLFRLPVGVPIVIIHGQDDVRVPIEHSRAFAAAAREAGDDVELHAPAALAHRAAIDPAGAHWPLVLDALERLRDRARRTSQEKTS